ncbi:MAG: leucine-rich repeat domain-containing protein, partial [Prevotella sp.]|nr:leucine-rich repeat domain-containing protein [Prevotella sp.]
MPSIDQIFELYDNCTCEWTNENGVNGCRFTSSNGSSIFIPAAGCRQIDLLFDTGEMGYYWSSSLYENSMIDAYGMGFEINSQGYIFPWRYLGHSVRPVAVSSTSGIIIDKNTFPDDNFRNWVLGQDYGQDGVLTDEEIAGVIRIVVNNMGIADLKGIEYFTALTRLYCESNQLTSLDMSKNTALKSLYCKFNQLTSLDVSKNTDLKELWCNGNQLASLDVSKNTALTELYCENNQLTSLDVSKNTALSQFNCFFNQLTTLDISKNAALTRLGCSNNQLTSLDVSKNTALTYLNCGWNQLTSLDVSKNTALTQLDCYNNQIKGTA